jgi:hypothetical protein
MVQGHQSIARRLAMATAILVAASATPAFAEGDGAGQWYQPFFASSSEGKKSIRANLGGPSSASKPSLTGREPRRQASKSSGVRTASLGSSRSDAPARSAPVTGGGVNWVASSGCLDGSLKSVIYNIASRFGSVTVSSTCRSAGHNRRVGGAPRSKHLSGDAADFRVSGNVSAVYAALRSSSVGGLKHYGGGLFHIDNGDRRSW